MKKIFITTQYPGESVKRLSKDYEVKIYPNPTAPTPGELIQYSKDCSAILISVADVLDKRIIDSCPYLEVVSNAAVGYENIDVPYATEKGIYVTNIPHVVTESTADLAWSLMMSVARRIIEADTYVRQGEFKCWHPSLLLGMNVSGKTLGIYGLGRIGTAVARRAKGFDMNILYHNRHRNEVTENETGASFVDFKSLLSQSDFIVITAPLNEESKGRFGSEEFAQMKPTSIIVNVGRGPIIKEAELARALADGVIWGGGLDVYENEPEVNGELMKLQNVVLVPHVGSASIETRVRMTEMAVRNIELALEGERPTNLVNTDVLKNK